MQQHRPGRRWEYGTHTGRVMWWDGHAWRRSSVARRRWHHALRAVLRWVIITVAALLGALAIAGLSMLISLVLLWGLAAALSYVL